AFNRLHRQSNEGGSVAQEFKTEYAVDRVSTFGTSFLGLTLGCARCHDHKFDPISQKEFFKLYAYFNSIKEYGLVLTSDIVPTPSILLPNEAQERKLTELRSELQRANSRLNEAIKSSPSRYATWKVNRPIGIPGLLGQFDLDAYSGKFLNKVDGPVIADRLGSPAEVDGVTGKALEFDGDNGLVIKGLPARERWDPFTWTFWLNDPRQSSPVVLLHRTGGTDVGFCGFDLILENGYITARVMRQWPGNAVAIRTKLQLPKKVWTHVGWSYDGSSTASGLRLYINGKPVETTVLADKLWKKINAHGDLGPSRGEWSFAQRVRESGFKGGKIDDGAFANRQLSNIELSQLFDGRALSAPNADLR
ncbi:MAG: DUF1549 domain-containing protein, partial [Armatimonadota bacterium]